MAVNMPSITANKASCSIAIAGTAIDKGCGAYNGVPSGIDAINGRMPNLTPVIMPTSSIISGWEANAVTVGNRQKIRIRIILLIIRLPDK